jgi:hypothetical protein
MPDLIRHPDVVPTKVGNHLKDWVPVFTGNPGFRLEFTPYLIRGRNDDPTLPLAFVPPKAGLRAGRHRRGRGQKFGKFQTCLFKQFLTEQQGLEIFGWMSDICD